MPMYPYECPECGYVEDVFKPMSECGSVESCPDCGAVMDRTYGRGPSTLDEAFHKPIEMFSVAPTGVDEFNELRQKLPDTEFTADLVPVAHNRSEKKRILEATGFEELS